MAILRLLTGQGPPGKCVAVPEDSSGGLDFLIGRDSTRCSLVLNSRTVSRTHARISYVDGQFLLWDLNSKAGTILNGGQLEALVGYPLKHRDLIHICDYVLAFSDPASASDGDSSSDRIVLVNDDDTSYYATLDSSAASLAQRTESNAGTKLAAMMRLAEDLRNTVDLEQLLAKVVDSLLAMFPCASRGVVLLQGVESGGGATTVARFRHPGAENKIQLSRRLLNEVLTKRQAVVPEDGMMMCAPLLDRSGYPLGVIQLGAESPRETFQDDDLDLLLTVALQVSVVIENSLLHETVLRERNLALELEIARAIQVSLLPASRPQIEGYEFFDYYEPAKHVGGDYYDYRLLPGNRLAILLGDVSGKGVPAALLMAKASTEFSVYLSVGMDPVQVVSTVNRRFAAYVPNGSFMTLVLAVLDWSTHQVTLVNAGHLRPLVRRRDGAVEEVGADHFGLPLGVLPDAEYSQAEFSLGSGEALLLFTDGITEAHHSRDRRLYSLKRLRTLFAHAEGGAEKIGRKVLDDIANFVGDNPQADDTCLLCVRRND